MSAYKQSYRPPQSGVHHWLKETHRSVAVIGSELASLSLAKTPGAGTVSTLFFVHCRVTFLRSWHAVRSGQVEIGCALVEIVGDIFEIAAHHHTLFAGRQCGTQVTLRSTIAGQELFALAPTLGSTEVA